MSKHRNRRRHLREGDSLRIEEFCRRHDIRRSTYYEFKRRGLGPREMRIGRIVRISATADRDWAARAEEEGEAMAVPVFAPKSSAHGVEGFDAAKTAHRRRQKRSKERVRVSASRSSSRGDDKHRDDNRTSPRQQRGRSKERGRDAAPKTSSRSEKHRGTNKIGTRRQKARSKQHSRDAGPKSSSHRDNHRDNTSRRKRRSKERGRDAAPRSSSRSDDHRDNDKISPWRQKERPKGGHGETLCDDDEAGRRRKRGRSKKRQRGRSEKAPSGAARTKPPLDITELKRRLKTGARLPKDALIESRRWRLPSNPHLNRDRDIERAMLQALTGPASSDAEERQAIEQANCTRDAPCGRLICWLCKHRTWFERRLKLTGLLDHDVPPDHISWVTIVIDVCKPSPKALHRPMSKFRSWLTEAADAWGVVFFGGFEVDLLLDPRRDLDTTTFKRKTLRALGLDPECSAPVAVFHVHLIAYHPDQDRGWLSLRLKQRLREPKRTLVKSLDPRQSQSEALDNLTRYPLKSLPPEAALFEAKSRSCRCVDPKALRLYNKLVNFLAGENGECIAKPTVTPQDT